MMGIKNRQVTYVIYNGYFVPNQHLTQKKPITKNNLLNELI
jgi:hypothetical protein